MKFDDKAHEPAYALNYSVEDEASINTEEQDTERLQANSDNDGVDQDA